MPFAYATPDLDAVPDRFTSTDSHLGENDGESPLLVARSRTRYNWPKCTTALTVTRIMALDHTAAQEGGGHRRDHCITIVDNLSMGKVEVPSRGSIA